MKTVWFFVLCLGFLLLGGYWYLSVYTPATDPQGPALPQAIYRNASADMIVVDTPEPGATLGTSFTVSGKARGGWYFEASFPLQIYAMSGEVLVEMPVQAEGEWMTPEFVPFQTTVTVPADFKGAAMLHIKNDNPSGLPENDASISIPIVIQ